MPAIKTKKSQFVRVIESKMKLYGVSHEELALALRMCPATLYRRKIYPDDFTRKELLILKKKNCKCKQTKFCSDVFSTAAILAIKNKRWRDNDKNRRNKGGSISQKVYAAT